MATSYLTMGARHRCSPFYASTLNAGATSFTVYNRMYMPTSYGDPEAEYRRLTEGVAIWDVAAERQVEISGTHAESLANYLSARDLRGMKVGRARYAPMCDHDGRLINDPVVLRVDEDRYWFSLADSEVLLFVRTIAGERGYDVTVREPDVSPLAVQGPDANALIGDLFGRELVDSLGFFHHVSTEIDGIPLVLCRSGWSKQGGFELFLTDGQRGNDLWDLVVKAGASYGIGPGTPNQRERIESGLLSFLTDHDADTDPIEAGLRAYTSIDGDHEYVGKECLIDRMADVEQRRPIVNVRLEGDPEPCEYPWPAWADQDYVGDLRAATWSDKLGAWLGLAQLQCPHAEPGSTVRVTTPGGNIVDATVSAEPFGTIQTNEGFAVS